MIRQVLHIAGGVAVLAVLGWIADQPAYAPFIRHGTGRLIFGGLLACTALWIAGCVLLMARARKAKDAPARHAWPYRPAGKR